MNKKSQLVKRLKRLKQEIRKHDDYYYNRDRPQISDWEYDKLIQELQEIENQHPELKTPDSPTQKMPGKPLEHFSQKTHTKPMLSLQNSYSIEDIKAFYQRTLKLLDKKENSTDFSEKMEIRDKKNLSFFLEPKLDGMAVELTYKEGLFSQALSRGDGNIGEDITAQVKTIKNLPLSLEQPTNDKSLLTEIIKNLPPSLEQKTNHKRILTEIIKNLPPSLEQKTNHKRILTEIIKNLPLSLEQKKNRKSLLTEIIKNQSLSSKNTEKKEQKKRNIPPVLEVRGEILILKKDFEKINKNQEEAGLAPFANPRNLVAGSVRQLDPKITASRPLKCFIHSMGGIELPFLKTQAEFLSYIQNLGLPVFRVIKECKNSGSVVRSPKYRISYNQKDILIPLEDGDSYSQKDVLISPKDRGSYSQKDVLISPKDRSSYSGDNVVHYLADIVSYYQDLQKLRYRLPFETDGIVIKVNEFEKQTQLGEIAKSPRWAMAGKFTPEQGETLLEKIKLQVGRTGVITPVAVLKPVKIGGVNIRHASLHNFKLLEKKDLREGDRVLVHRAGDVIPEILKSLRRPKVSKKFVAPKKCPVCKNPLKEQGDYLLCDFSHCPAVIENKLIHFASKKAMNIEFLGEKSIKAFCEWGWLKNYSDIYDLKHKKVAQKEGFGRKSHQLLVESLEKSKKSSLSRLIFALGIPLVGEQTAKSLSQFIYKKHQDRHQDSEDLTKSPSESIDKPDQAPFQDLLAKERDSLESFSIRTALFYLQSLSVEELETIEDIGPLVAKSFKSAFENPDLISDLKGLQQRGLHFAPVKTQNQTLKGLSFVITGTLPVPRLELKTKIEEQGGKVLSQVSSKTDFVIVGDNPGSKREKALKLSLPILSYEAFLERFFRIL